jgi:primosomal protein N''
MSGAIPPFPNTPSWRGAKLKHRDKFTFYRENVRNVSDMHDRIVRAAECVNNETLASTWRATEYRLEVCRATNGAILRSTQRIRNFIRSSV